nr:hypothetical protein [Bacilli bacterium]
MFCFIGVDAKEYYSEYGSFSKWDTNYVEKDELTDVEEKRLYKYYHEDIIGDYYLEGEAPDGYTLDKSKFKYSKYSSYTNEVPQVINGRIIESKEVLEYQRMVPISSIFIYNFNSALDISEIDIKDSNGNDINFDINCTNCSRFFSDSLNNNSIYDYNYSNIDSNIMITLRKELYYDDINVDIYLYDTLANLKAFDIAFLSKDEDIILFSNFREYFNLDDVQDIKKYTLNSSNMIVTNKWNKTTSKTIDKYTRVISNYSYRYRDLLYYYYKKDITYSDYLEKPTKYYPNQTEEYITYYRYRTREKVLYDELLNDYKSNKLVITNLNKDIELLRLENRKYIDDYNNYISDLNDKNLKINELNISLENNKLLLENKELEKNKITKEFENELLNLKMEEETREVRSVPLLKIGDNYIYILPIIFLILILSLLFILRKKKKN